MKNRLLEKICPLCREPIQQDDKSTVYFAGHFMHSSCKKIMLSTMVNPNNNSKEFKQYLVNPANKKKSETSNFSHDDQKSSNEDIKKRFTFKNVADFRDQLIKEISNIHLEISETRKDIESVVAPKFLNVSIQTKDLIELGIEVWRLEQRLTKILPTLPENQRDLINNSMQKLVRYLNKNDVDVIDHTNQKFNDGRNLDVLAVEKGANVSEPIVKETKEPTIIYKNQVVHKGKVIVLEKSGNKPV